MKGSIRFINRQRIKEATTKSTINKSFANCKGSVKETILTPC